MRRMISTLLISGVLLCGTLPALAAESTGFERPESTWTQEEAMPDSVLYYGQIWAVDRDETGAVSRLHLTSEAQGDFVMRITADTVWVDSGLGAASDPSTLAVGEELYVFHSPVSTRSLPPQSEAYAVVRGVPQGSVCAQYHEVETITETDGGHWTITTDNGGLLLSGEEETAICTYDGDAVSFAEIQAGDRIMAWYPIVLLSYPGQAHVQQLMLLPQAAAPAMDTETGGTESASLTIALQ